MAFKDGIDWILHIDTDELVYPGGAAEFSLQRVLMDVPADVDTLVFPNYESLPERDDVVTPFTEVRLSPTHNVSSFRGPIGHESLGNGRCLSTADRDSARVRHHRCLSTADRDSARVRHHSYSGAGGNDRPWQAESVMLPEHDLLEKADSSGSSLDLLHARISGAARLHWVNKKILVQRQTDQGP